METASLAMRGNTHFLQSLSLNVIFKYEFIIRRRMTTIDDKFHQAVDKWKEHCRENAHFSLPERYLDCEAYLQIVSMGSQILPLIRNQLNSEYETDVKYDAELERLEIKVFGTANVELLFDNYFKICKDEEYKKYQERYRKEVMGNPGILWCEAIKKIVPEFDLPVGEKNSGSPVERVGSVFVALDVRAVQKATIKWLDENMHKYVSS